MPQQNGFNPSHSIPSSRGIEFLKNLSSQLKPEIILIILSSFFGVLLIITIAPFQIPDEYQHFGKAYMISELRLFQTQGEIPQGFMRLFEMTNGMPFNPTKEIPVSEILARLRDPLSLDKRWTIELPASSVYTPLPYISSAFGLAIGRWTGIPPLIAFYLGRLMNLAVWITLTFFALKFTPVFKWTFLLLILTPMSLSQAGSYSADSLTNGISFLWIAVCLNYALINNEQKLKLFDYFVLALFAILFPLLKAPYAVLIGLVFLIPLKRYPSRKHAVLFFVILLLMTTILVVITSGTNRDYYFSKIPFPGVDGFAQLEYMIRNPLVFIWAAMNTLQQEYVFMGTSYIGILGWLDTRLPDMVYLFYFLMIIIVALLDHTPTIRMKLEHKLILAAVSVLSYFGVAAGQYVTWTPVASKMVSDIQGRYLIPIAPTAILLLYNQRINKYNWLVPILVIGVITIVLSIAVITVTRRYWIIF